VTQEEASAAVFARWLALWPSLSGAVPYSVDTLVVPESIPHARVAIRSLPSDQHTLGAAGNRKWIRTGLVDVRLVGPINAGRGSLDRLAGHVRTIFEGKRIGPTARDRGITTHATSISELRRDRDAPQLWILGCTTPFEYYEIS
jgi:hypothetical protein